MRTIAQPTVSVNPATDALLAANTRLQQLREQVAADTCGQLQVVASKQIDERKSDLIAVGETVLAQRRLADEVGQEKSDKTAQERGSFLVIPTIDESAASSCVSAETPTPILFSTDNRTFLRMYPDLLLGMLRSEQAAIGRIWLLCRHLDEDGRGWLDVAFVREQLTRKGSPLRIVGQRRLRQILKAGAGVFWERDDFGRLWLYGVARVAAALSVDRLSHRPIALPIADLVTSLAHTRAHCYAAFHSGRKVAETCDLANPISREVLTELSGVTDRTQRRYDDLAGVQSRTCIAIGAPFDATQHREAAWQHGNAIFKLSDHLGQHGVAGNTYTAWQLPNQYRGCHTQLPTGRQRKLNLQLRLLTNNHADLVTQRARGNDLANQKTDHGERAFVRRFFADGGQVIKSHATNPVYWFDHATSNAGVWMPIS